MAQLESGNAYSLSEIFCGENDKIIIPDLQRDYCWGNPISDNSEESLVSSFMDSLLNLDKNEDITMGLIYGYYDYKLTPYHLQLCDGQQRLTTLFLVIGVLNRMLPEDKFKELLISNFELEKDDNEPHLLYGIRESSLYFLSDLTIHYFLDKSLSITELEDQYWFLNSYHHDPTIASIIRALTTIEGKLANYQELCTLGTFLTSKLKFLFYDMGNRQNGEETFVVINTTGEPLTANQNLKPLIMLANPSYSRSVCEEKVNIITYDAAHDWEIMETWFWKNRRKNGYDTSTEGMLAFLHCVRILESGDEASWHKTYETSSDKFPLSIKMERIWKWFCAYKRVYETDYRCLYTPNVVYPESQHHYTQKDLYAILPAMFFCQKFPNASDINVQRMYHILYNMARYRNVYRSSQNDPINVPAFRMCNLINALLGDDIIGLLDNPAFNIVEERVKLNFIKKYALDNERRFRIEKIFAEAEDFNIYDGQIATLIDWSKSSFEHLTKLFLNIKKMWMNGSSRNKLRQALLAYGVEGYPMPTGTVNYTLCSKTEWRTLFEQQGQRMLSFIEQGDIEKIYKENKDKDSLYKPLICNIDYLDYAKDHKIRIHAQNVIEVMAKTKANGDFLLFHNNVVFEKILVDMKKWCGFWVWSNGEVSVFYTYSTRYNITLDMNITSNGYKIIAWLDRHPAKKSIDTEILEGIGFQYIDGIWSLPEIEYPEMAKEKFVYITQYIDENSAT